MKKIYVFLMITLLSSGVVFAANPFGNITNAYPPLPSTNYGEAYVYHKLLSRLENEFFDNQKLNETMQFLVYNHVTTFQVAKIGSYFTGDNSRLAFMKAAYAHCTDPFNYRRLQSSFTFQYNFNQLMNFVRQQGNNGYNNGYPNNGNPYTPNYGNGGYGNPNGNGQPYPNQGQGPYYNPGYGNNNQYFSQILKIIKDESFDNNRLKIANSYAAHNQLSAMQIKEIVETFSFDSYRLKFAKAAYRNCYDKQNYLLLRSAFTFTSNYNSLITYINR